MLKAHPAYRAAKAGDTAAAADLIRDLAAPLVGLAEKRVLPDAIFVAPDAKEAAGDNAIPGMLVAALTAELQGTADRSIVQTNRAYHTGADPMERLISRATFEGEVQPGRHYVLVDDVTTMGSTLADLGHHVQAGADWSQA